MILELQNIFYQIPGIVNPTNEPENIRKYKYIYILFYKMLAEQNLS